MRHVSRKSSLALYLRWEAFAERFLTASFGHHCFRSSPYRAPDCFCHANLAKMMWLKRSRSGSILGLFHTNSLEVFKKIWRTALFEAYHYFVKCADGHYSFHPVCIRCILGRFLATEKTTSRRWNCFVAFVRHLA